MNTFLKTHDESIKVMDFKTVYTFLFMVELELLLFGIRT